MPLNSWTPCGRILYVFTTRKPSRTMKTYRVPVCVRSAGTVHRVLPAPRPRRALSSAVGSRCSPATSDEREILAAFVCLIGHDIDQLRSSFGNKSRYHRRNQLEAIPAATLVFDIAEMCRMATLVTYVSAVYVRDHATELKA